MDRDAAIGTDGAQLAQDIMENELVMGTDAYKNGHLIYLAHPAVWYTAEGGITALDIMLQDLERRAAALTLFLDRVLRPFSKELIYRFHRT